MHLTLSFPHCARKSVLYVCICIPALKIGSSGSGPDVASPVTMPQSFNLRPPLLPWSCITRMFLSSKCSPLLLSQPLRRKLLEHAYSCSSRTPDPGTFLASTPNLQVPGQLLILLCPPNVFFPLII